MFEFLKGNKKEVKEEPKAEATKKVVKDKVVAKTTPKVKKEKKTKRQITEVGKLLREKRLEGILSQPKYTEKAATLSQKGVYVFEITPKATKTNIKDAFEQIYKKRPEAVRIVAGTTKQMSQRRFKGVGVKNMQRKAYITLKRGDTISLS